MARETLPVALDLMFGHEGGYVNSNRDRGGATKPSRSKRAHLSSGNVTRLHTTLKTIEARRSSQAPGLDAVACFRGRTALSYGDQSARRQSAISRRMKMPLSAWPRLLAVVAQIAQQ